MIENAPRGSTLVLSSTPLRADLREALRVRVGPDLSFADLPALRRDSLPAIFARLRRKRVDRVVVAGPADELRLFGDYLIALAFVPTRARRELQAGSEEPVRLSPGRLLRALLRIASGFVAGLATLAVAWLRVARLRITTPRAPLLGSVSRCLFLKPSPFFGISVGGSVGHVAGVANALARCGTTLRLLSAHVQSVVGPAVEQVVVAPDFLVSFPYELNQYRYQGIFLKEAKGHTRAFDPGVIYQRYGLNDLTGVLLKRRYGRPLVLEFNGSEVWVQRHWGDPLRFEGLAAAVERINVAEADLVVVVSAALVPQVVALGARPERVLFYPNCVDPSVFDPGRFGADDRRRSREALGVPAQAQLLTFVGTFGRWHGTDVLATAIRRLIDTQRPWLEEHRAHFLFVGDGLLAPKVSAILGRGLGAPFVTLAGMRSQAETPGLLAASDVLLSPHVPNPDGTPFFGSPTKLFEYMAMAKPIVASDLDQIGWVLRGWRPGTPPPEPAAPPSDDRAALLVEPGNLDALLAGLREALELPDAERISLGARARRLVLESFTWDKNVQAMLGRLQALSAAS